MKKFFGELMQDESGLTLLEYVIGAALIVAASVGIYTTFFGTLTTKLSGIANGL